MLIFTGNMTSMITDYLVTFPSGLLTLYIYHLLFFFFGLAAPWRTLGNCPENNLINGNRCFLFHQKVCGSLAIKILQ